MWHLCWGGRMTKQKCFDDNPGELISPGNCPQHIFCHSNHVSSPGRLDVLCLKRHVSTRHVFRVSECRTEAVNSTIIEGLLSSRLASNNSLRKPLEMGLSMWPAKDLAACIVMQKQNESSQVITLFEARENQQTLGSILTQEHPSRKSRTIESQNISCKKSF